MTKSQYDSNIVLHQNENEEKIKENGDPKKGSKKEKDKDKDKDKKDPKKDDTPTISYMKMFRYATPLDIFLLIIGTLCAMATGVLQPLNTILSGTLSKQMIDYTILLHNLTSPKEIEEATDVFIQQVTHFAIYNSIIGVGIFISCYVSTETFNYTAIRQIFKIRSIYLRSSLNQDIGWFDVNQTGDFASRMSDDLNKLEEGLGEKIPMFIAFQATSLASVIIGLVKGWELALVCLTSFPAAMTCIGIIGILTTKLAKKEMDAYGDAGTIAEEVLSSIRTVIAFGGEELESKRYDENLGKAAKNNIFRAFLSACGFGLLWFVIFGNYALSFWYGIRLILKYKYDAHPKYGVDTMITVFFSVMSATMNFGISSPYIEAFGQSKAAGSKIFSVIDHPPTINASKNKGKQISEIKGKISFKDVHFKYPSREDVPILNGLDLEIAAGDTVALVGSSGCGKSTCIQLIQRFYDPLSGSVHLDGEDIKDLDLTWMRRNIGVVGQEPVLFGTTIEENIRYGNMQASMEDIIDAAKRANAHDFVSKLPLAYNTLVGERGAQLSGGQKQRIAIARALARNPKVLLLDEATSALDTNSEKKVQAALDSASKHCTTIIVAHRLSTIKGANKIVVLKEGKVVEQGTHEELMSLKDEYYQLVMNQVNAEMIGLTDLIEDGEKARVSFNDLKRGSVVSAASEVHDFDTQTEDEIIKTSLWTVLKMNSPEWYCFLIGGLGAAFMGCVMPIFGVLFGNILGVFSKGDDEYIRTESNKYCLYFIIAGVVSGTAVFNSIFFFSMAGEKLTRRFRSRMFKAMIAQEMGWFDRKENGTGALCSRLSTEAAHIQGASGQRLSTIVQSLVMLGCGIALAMYYQWKLGLVCMAFVPIILLATFFQQRLMNSSNKTQHKSLQESTKLAVEAISNIRTVASLVCEETFHNLYIDQLEPYNKKSLRDTHVRAGVLGLARSILFFAFATCMYYGGILIRDGEDYTNVYKVSQALLMGTVSIANGLAFSPNLQKGLTAAGRALKLLNRVPKIRNVSEPIDTDWNKGDFKYSEIFFSYPTRETSSVLKGLDLDVLQGKTVALVGPSGCGKSTIVQLMERFYDPSSGVLSVDGESTANIALRRLRSQLGIVSQEPVLFDRTIAENIAYGDNSRVVGIDEVIEAAKNANIHNYISTLPLGYETRLGEKGAQLSGGQKQRVAIARALVRNPKVLLLDEATSALDTESERVVQEALDSASEGRTCITIAHRLTTIQNADVICVINKGKVAELGTHSELINLKGLYYKMYTVQGK